MAYNGFMRRPFDEVKATQAAASFLKLSGGRMHYMLLLKLMYMMDREAILRWGRPVTNDKYYSLPKGPILSRVYDLMTEEPSPWEHGFWAAHISEPSRFAVDLLEDAGDGELSEAEEDLIREVFERYGKFDRFKLIDLLHEILPEWKDPQGSRLPISIRDILNAGNKPPEEINTIEEELEAVDLVHAAFGKTS